MLECPVCHMMCAFLFVHDIDGNKRCVLCELDAQSKEVIE